MDDHMVTAAMCEAASRSVEQLGPRPATVRLSKLEPELVAHIERGMDAIWQLLDACGVIGAKATGRIDSRLYPAVLRVIVSSIEATRQSHYQLFRDTAVGTRLEQLDPSLKSGTMTADG